VHLMKFDVFLPKILLSIFLPVCGVLA